MVKKKWVLALIIIGLYSLGLLFPTTGALAAQEPAEDIIAVWEVDLPPEGGWTVGDPLPLRLRVIAPNDSQVIWPELPEQWEDFEIQSQTVEMPVLNVEDGTTTYILAVTAILWEPGGHEVPESKVQVQIPDGETQEVSPHPLTITIESVLPEVEDETIEKKDLKPQAELPRPPIWPWVLAGIVAAPLLYLAGRWLWQKLPRPKGKEEVADEGPVDLRPPEEIAYERLAEIAALDLPAKGEFKQHYSLVTECLKAYIEGIYEIPALDRTTYELTAQLRQIKLDQALKQLIRKLLEEADLVKFAKFEPGIPQAQEIIPQARSFIDATKPEHVPLDEKELPATPVIQPGQEDKSSQV